MNMDKEKFYLKYNNTKNKLYNIWRNLKVICYNQTNARYKHYGEKGIQVDTYWKSNYRPFLNWAYNNHYNDKLHLVRLDITSDFNPENCILSEMSEHKYHNLPAKCNLTKHGLTKSRIYSLWSTMKGKCLNKNHVSYSSYGAAGIKVNEDWKNSFLDFKNWAISNGYEDNLYLVRRDVTGHYEPGNCFFAETDEMHFYKKHQEQPLRLKYPKLYTKWAFLKRNCKNEDAIRYKIYGGEGINFYEEWEDFEAFCKWALQNNYEEGLYIRRRDNEDDFNPENCFISQRPEKKKKANLVMVNGEKIELQKAAEMLKIPLGVLKAKLKEGYTIEKIKEFAMLSTHIDGELLTLTEISLKYNIPYATLYSRYAKGISGYGLVEDSRPKQHFVDYKGKKITLKQLAKLTGVEYKTIQGRHYAGKRGDELIVPKKGNN